MAFTVIVWILKITTFKLQDIQVYLIHMQSMEELKESYKSELTVSNSKLTHSCKHKEYVKYIQNNKRTLPLLMWVS